MNFKSINFRQPKYIFPLVVAIPLGCLLYFITNMFMDFTQQEEEPSDFIQTQLPEPKLEESKDKKSLMENRYSIENAMGAVGGFDSDEQGMEKLDGSEEYTESEANDIYASEMERLQMERAQRQLEASQSRFNNGYGSGYQESYNPADDIEAVDPYEEMEANMRRHKKRMKEILDEPDEEELQRAEEERKAREERERKAAEEAPREVIKADNLVHSKFNTVSTSGVGDLDSPLIKAMIDQTTKSTDGTRLRFKLLDDVVIEDIKLKKGTFVYGTVTGFGNQRVMANISSILVGDRFIKVSLNVYDTDGMEGFYVPESSFRTMLQNAAAGIAGQSINFNQNGGMSNGIDMENIAMQSIQNVYQAVSSAISGNLRKNKAKIKYNTIVYLINSKN